MKNMILPLPDCLGPKSQDIIDVNDAVHSPPSSPKISTKFSTPALTLEPRCTTSSSGLHSVDKTNQSLKTKNSSTPGIITPSSSLKRASSDSIDVKRTKRLPITLVDEVLHNLVQLPLDETGQCGTLTWSTSVEHSYRTETYGVEGPGFTAEEVLNFKLEGGEKIDFSSILPHLLVDPLPPSARMCPGAVFISLNGIDALVGNGTAEGLWKEYEPLPEPKMPPIKDKKRFAAWVATQETHHEPTQSGGMRWDLVKEHYGGIAVCRKRLCTVAVAGMEQTPKYDEGKQRVYDLCKLKYASQVRESLSIFGPKATDLNCEGNLYWNPEGGPGNCNIPWHRDAERKLVIGTRWGNIRMYILWAPFYEGRPVGVPICKYLPPGALYVMSFEAAGWAPAVGGGWSAKNSKAFHWKHAAGHRIEDCLGKHEKTMKSLVRRWCIKHSKAVPDWAK
jgi:hypothetical protein